MNSDAAYEKILQLTTQLNIDGYISRVNPDKYPGVTNSKYDRLLLELHRRDFVALPHPDLMKVRNPRQESKIRACTTARYLKLWAAAIRSQGRAIQN